MLHFVALQIVALINYFPVKKEVKSLSSLEHKVLTALWSLAAPSTAEQIRRELTGEKNLKDSTVRTLLRRLEEKGYLTHDVENRTFIYRPLVEPQNAAAQAVRQIIKKFCGGSVEKLLIGMVADEMVSPKELKKLAEQIAEAENQHKKPL